MGGGASTQVQPRYKWDADHTLKGPWTFLFKEKVQCACEGSKWCTRENPAKQKAPNAIAGLHASWVGDRVLAMARPWQAYVEQYRLVDAFKQANIGMILNLQEVGEHASCGPGNLPGTGFTYDPESFMAAGIGYYNFSWRDMGVPSLDRMMDIVQVMDYVTRVEGRKIAVHCHAGLGRTGLSIACFFVFSGLHESPEDAIAATRRQRAGAVQTSKQAAFVTIFGQYLRYLRCVFVPRPAAPGAGGSLAAGKRVGSTSAMQNAGAGGGAGGGGGQGHGHSLATQSAPPAAGHGGGPDPHKAAAAALPQGGLLEAKTQGTSLVGVYASGLTVTVPLLSGGAGGGGAGGGGGADDALTDEDLGLKQPLPWNDSFHIQPQHARDFKPMPPTSYTEALARQARLLHGPERRALLRLHKLVKECVFRIMAAAQAFQPPAQPPPAAAAAAAATAPVADPHGGAAAAALPPNFAAAVAHLIRHHSHGHVDTPGLAPLAAHPAYVELTGPSVEAADVTAVVSDLKEQINAGRYEGLGSAPLLAVLMLLEAFFGNFTGGGRGQPGAKPEETCSLTPECLTVVSKTYQDLFDGHVPATPGSAAAAAANGTPGVAAAGHTNGAHAASADGKAPKAGAGGTEPLAVAKQAYEILEPLQPRDSELLLVFAALMRVVARVSGPGCEEAVVEVGKWAVGLLLGRLAGLMEAETAVLSFLWWLAGRDEAFAMLVLLKRQRIAGGLGGAAGSGRSRSKGGGGKGVDVAAMLAAAAASFAAPPEAVAAGGKGGAPLPGAVPAAAAAGAALPPATPAQLEEEARAEAAAAAAAAAATSLAAGDGIPPRAPVIYDPNDPAMLPALQLAQLLSQDIQQLYRTSFRDAIAGISTVLYPPPPHTGRIDVHDVWR
ncbi:hypothetical protein HYH02_005054 [Chlamydomonas schloesseri]|uniref:Tyrosine specific protein phosphatases domain-containing protein n=1 Tax=Chlamydomonas schloesseri TaxID=2026947 RepID=A0A835WMJ8_9CHLO|nr:hypothetical protein HYH02_005054 [Chlamydomonas schloesseri]|eukprot:KAG2450553.1 hypothetical protein HYH02_005054 [Chlamydomonas schloesseri]